MAPRFAPLFFVTLVLAATPALAQDPDAPPVETAEQRAATRTATLKALQEQIATLDEDIAKKKKDLDAAKTPEEKKQLSRDLQEALKNREEFAKNFRKTAAEVDLSPILEKAEISLDWQKELMVLLSPLVHELKSLTERPRKLDRLRTDIGRFRSDIPTLKTAVANIEVAASSVTDQAVKDRLAILKRDLKREQANFENRLDVAQRELQEMEKEDKPILESGQDFFKMFFKSRGRNLGLAVLSFVLVFFVLRLTHRLIRKISPFHRKEKRSFLSRVFDVLFLIMTILGASGVTMWVLYITGDWVLLSLLSLFLLGVFWTARHQLPRMWEQIKMMLNIGAVREGERLVYNGVPWRVAKINIYSTLDNPALKNCHIRLPINDLIDMTSRPYETGEAFFPSEVGDCVALADGTWGKVVFQSHEAVVLKTPHSSKVYGTGSYLGNNPTNLSHNFRVATTFGIDYKHQADCTRAIPEAMRAHMLEGIKREPWGQHLLDFVVAFKSAGASSLDYVLCADIGGEAATSYGVIARVLQRLAVDACNQYGWEIPFAQMVVHRAELGADSNGSADHGAAGSASAADTRGFHAAAAELEADPFKPPAPSAD